MRVLLCGGGTAGHVMPAIAMAEIIKKHFPKAAIAFVGREGGKENEAYVRTGHKLYEIKISGFSRSFSINNIKTVFNVIKSGRLAKSIINDFKPDIIIGTGGYVCYPLIRQGQRLNIKTIIHESNASPGLVTKLLGGRCDKVLLNIASTEKYLKRTDNIAVVGNPLRRDFSYLTKSDARKRLGIKDAQVLIVSFGGSLGSEVLNKHICDLISRYTLKDNKLVHIHSTGRSHFDRVKAEHPKLFSTSDNIRILPYIEDVPTALIAADIAITRSGAMTISELCRSKTASILIPSPNVTANHQLINAKEMERIGASVVIEEKALSSELLNQEIRRIIDTKDLLRDMAENAHLAFPKNTEKIIASILKIMISDK